MHLATYVCTLLVQIAFISDLFGFSWRYIKKNCHYIIRDCALFVYHFKQPNFNIFISLENSFLQSKVKKLKNKSKLNFKLCILHKLQFDDSILCGREDPQILCG